MLICRCPVITSAAHAVICRCMLMTSAAHAASAATVYHITARSFPFREHLSAKEKQKFCSGAAAMIFHCSLRRDAV